MRPTPALVALCFVPLFGCGFLWPHPSAEGDSGAPVGEASALDCAEATFFGEQSDRADAGLLVGRVVSPSGAVPVAGAEVTVVGSASWVISAEAGCFAVAVEPGEVEISVDKGRYHRSVTREVDPHERVDLGDVHLDDGGLRVAVIDGEYDSVELLLRQLGVPYDSFPTTEGAIETLHRYDAVFANCGSATSRTAGLEHDPADLAELRAWIEAGGTLYASDLEWALFAGAAPEALTFGPTVDDVLRGEMGTVTATVRSRDVVHLLGTDQTDITFDLPYWAVIDGPGEAEVVVEGPIDGATRPLAALHRLGAGRAVFTSFHNDHQATADMQTILFELILAL